MNPFITPFLLLLITFGLGFFYMDPQYAKINTLKIEQAKYTEAVENSVKLQKKRDELFEISKRIEQGDKDKLSVMLPDNIDNVRLMIDMEGIASKYNLTLDGLTASASGANKDSLGSTGSQLGSVNVSFSVTTSYNQFKVLLHALESSLRLLDVTTLSLTSGEKGDYTYKVNLKTYWLK